MVTVIGLDILSGIARALRRWLTLLEEVTYDDASWPKRLIFYLGQIGPFDNEFVGLKCVMFRRKLSEVDDVHILIPDEAAKVFKGGSIRYSTHVAADCQINPLD